MLVIVALLLGPTIKGWAGLVLSVSHGQLRCTLYTPFVKGDGKCTPLCCVGLQLRCAIWLHGLWPHFELTAAVALSSLYNAQVVRRSL